MARQYSRIPYAVTAALSLGMILAAWVGRDSFRPVGAGERAPGFEFRNLAGEPMSLEDLRGKVVLVNIWATWCPPCRSEMPSMQRLYDRMKEEGVPFEILAVSVDAALGNIDPRSGNPGGDVEAFAKEMGLNFPILYDRSGGIQDDYQTTGLPESFLVGPDGVIYRKVTGGTLWDSPDYEQLIRRLLEE